MESLEFIKQYMTKPKIVGAILPSSKRLASKMIESIDFEKAKCIVEYGPGTGVFTEFLLQNRREDTKLILIEYNEFFYTMLLKKYGANRNLYIINDSAECIDKYLCTYGVTEVDYVVSGLPFASLPKEISNNVLNVTNKVLNDTGRFVTFQYTLLKKRLICSFFNSSEIKYVLGNVPPAYVLVCKK